MYGVQANVRQLCVSYGGSPHGLQGGRRYHVYLLVRAGHGKRAVRFPQSHVVREQGAMVQAQGGMNTGHCVALMRQ